MAQDRKDPRELLSLLSTRAASTFPMPPGYGSLTLGDIAFAIAHLPQVAMRLAEVKYLGAYEQLENLATAVCRHVMMNHAIDGWRLPRSGFILDMSRLAVAEIVDPVICILCAGRGSVKVDTRIIECTDCGGSGHRKVLGKDRAQSMGMEQTAWTKRWAPRFENIYRELLDWDRQIGEALRTRLGRTEDAEDLRKIHGR